MTSEAARRLVKHVLDHNRAKSRSWSFASRLADERHVPSSESKLCLHQRVSLSSSGRHVGPAVGVSGVHRPFSVLLEQLAYRSNDTAGPVFSPLLSDDKMATHGTASVFINDDESGLHSDFEKWLEKLAPEKPYSQYAHNGFEDNADAHLKRTVMGREVVVAVTGGKLDLGPWEQVFYGEFDGKRRKRVLVKIIGE